MKTQPPEQNPNDYDEVTRLRLQLHHAESQRDAFQKAFNTEVMKVMRASVIQASISTDNEIARLNAEVTDLKSEADRFKAEVDGLSAQLVELDDLKAEVERLTELNATLALRYDATKSMLDGCAKEIEEMEAEVERLTKAGDALAGKAISLEYNDYWSEYEKVEDVCIDEVEAWHKAKEGKQS